MLPLDELVKDTTYQTATLTVLALRYIGTGALRRGLRPHAGNCHACAGRFRDHPDCGRRAGLGRGLSGRHRLDAAALTPGYGELTDILSPHQSETASQTGDAHTDDGSIAQAETIENEADETENTPQEQPKTVRRAHPQSKHGSGSGSY